jgi:hypothetical protein
MLRERFFGRDSGPVMVKVLVAALVTACLVNAVCLFSHIGNVVG